MLKTMIDTLEQIIRPIVEGQIRGFAKEHPKIIDAVDWYKPRADKQTTFVNSLAKRILRDLLCPTQRARLEAAVMESRTVPQSNSSVALVPAGEAAPVGTRPDRSAPALT